MKISSLAFTALASLGLALGGSLAFGAEESPGSLPGQAKITRAAAEKTALARVPGGKTKSAELERENGVLVWSFDIAMPRTKNVTEVQVDAETGKIVSTKIETPAAEAAEKAAETKKNSH